MTPDAASDAWQRVGFAVDIHREALRRRDDARRAYLSAAGDIDQAAQDVGDADARVADALDAVDRARAAYCAVLAAEKAADVVV